MRVSNAVDKRVRELWAALATVSAAMAMAEVRADRIAAAERLAGVTANWLAKAGAQATENIYSRPRV